MYGEYNAINMAAAFTVGEHFNVDRQLIIDSLSIFRSTSNRSEIITYHGCTLIKDAYNANPSSMESAIKSFSESYPSGWLILGDMKELGSESHDLHLHIINTAASYSFDKIILLGKEFKAAYENLNGKIATISLAEDIEQLKEKWNWDECMGKSLLLKGSRSMHLEKLLED